MSRSQEAHFVFVNKCGMIGSDIKDSRQYFNVYSKRQTITMLPTMIGNKGCTMLQEGRDAILFAVESLKYTSKKRIRKLLAGSKDNDTEAKDIPLVRLDVSKACSTSDYHQYVFINHTSNTELQDGWVYVR